ncbi:MAG: ABC transporter substrate-binding protein [Chloroflexota bacterium]|nr:ABC transporter substrate-binding protein [Chloroflexota bacterium]
MSEGCLSDTGFSMTRRDVVRLLGVAGATPLAAWMLAGSVAPASAQDTSTTSAEEPQPGGELIVGLDQEPPTLDPHASPSAVTYQIMSSVAESLLYLNSERQLQPWLAEAWEGSADGSSYTFNLRRDVTFHNGEPFNAAAVKWNFDRIVDPNFQAGGALAALAGYAGSEVIDEYTVKVNFETSYAPFLNYAAGGTLGIVSPTAAQEIGDQFGTKVVATGPFKVESYTAKDNVTLVRNEEYNRTAPWSARQGSALLERIVFKFIPESSTRVTTLETGETNLIGAVPSQDLPRLEESDEISITKTPWVGIPRILMLNTQLAPTDEVNVRRAVSLAIDRQALVDTVFAGTGEVAIGMLTRVMLDDPSLSQPYDPEQAKQLLEQAGWVGTDGVRQKDGQALTFILNVVDYGGGAPPEAQFIQANLLDVGFDCQIKAQARAPWYEDNYNCRTHGPLMFLRSGDYDGLYSMFHSSLVGQNFGFACLQDPDIDALLERGRAETEPNARREIYLEAERRLAEIGAAAPLVDEYAVYAGDSAVQGLQFNGFTYPVFGDVWLRS